MGSQVVKLFLLSLILLAVGCAKFENDQQVIKEYSSTSFKVFENDEFPKDLTRESNVQDLANMIEEMGLPHSRSIIEWSPDGSYDNPVEASCLYSNLDYLFSISNLSNRSRAQAIQNWVDRCQNQLSSGVNRFMPLLMFETVRYNMVENKNLTKVKITLNDGTILRGILGIKNDGKKRPLIIIQSGVHSNAEDSGANRNFIMQIFDEGPFNVLLLGNMTGSEYLRDNGTLAIGGMEEGRHIIEVAQMLRNPESKIQNYVSDIHLLGVSLGSHAALYTSLYNSYLESPPIQSVMAYCPVINLEPTVESTFDRSLRGFFYNMQTVNVLKKSFNHVPVISELLGQPKNWSREETLLAVKQAAFDYYKKATLKKPWTLKPFEGKVFKSEEDVWSLNNFISQSNNVKTPTLIVYSEDDFFVLPNLNSNALAQNMKSSPNPNIGIVKFDTGNHCAASVANGWPTTSTLLRSYFLSQSFEKQTYESGTADISRYVKLNFNRNQTINKIVWSLSKKNNLLLNIDYFDRTDNACFFHKPFKSGAPQICYGSKQFEISPYVLERFGVSVPDTKFKKESLIRWLNTHINVLDKFGESVVGKNMSPTQLLVYGNYEY